MATALKISETQAPPTPSESNQRSGSQNTPHIAPHKATAMAGSRLGFVPETIIGLLWPNGFNPRNVTFGPAVDIPLTIANEG
jgi:hypothetical protein